MRYDIHVSDGSHFELEREEPLNVGDYLTQFSVVYQVTGISPLSPEESDEFDAIVEVGWRAGPPEAG